MTNKRKPMKEIAEILESMSDEEKEELTEKLKKTFNKPVEDVRFMTQQDVCQCCHCRSKRGLGTCGSITKVSNSEFVINHEGDECIDIK